MSPRRLPQRQRDTVIHIASRHPGGMGDFIRFMSDDTDRGARAPGQIVRDRTDDFPRPCSIDPPEPSREVELRIAG